MEVTLVTAHIYTFDEDSQTAMVFRDSFESRQPPNIKGLKAVDALLRCGRRTTM